jgi:CheY-like chemotaxis protein
MANSILVVDDNPLNVKLARAVLVLAGYEVRSACDATTMFAQLEAALPHLIIMDLMLPDIDGFELARQLKRDPRFADIPIIAMTASGLLQDEERARLVGCDGFLEKPFENETLVSTVAHYMR